MPTAANDTTQKRVRVIPATVSKREEINAAYRQLRVAAYCRVSTKEEEQLNSYELQKRYYTERIEQEPKWALAGIYADKGISGTSVKKRDEFNRMIRDCKRGKIDMIITKSISRFARNTVDCLNYIRTLREIHVDVYFEEQNLHSSQAGAEFYITLYGSIAQSESENISANVRFGKAQSAKEGKVSFNYSSFLGYRKGADGNPEIDPEQAEIVKRIYSRFLAGDSLKTIACSLNADRVPTATGKGTWVSGTVRSILTNEKYKGDALLNKTYVTDCISKKVRMNTGERPMYYVENSHPAIIDAATYARVQEEIARRSGRSRTNPKSSQRVQVKYSSKYALTDLLICGKCRSAYRRCVWNIRGKKKVVWRCISRVESGKRLCPDSPAISEQSLQYAIMEAIKEVAQQRDDLIDTLKVNIGMAITSDPDDNPILSLERRIAEIDREYNQYLTELARDLTQDSFDDFKVKSLINEKRQLQLEIEQYRELEQRQLSAASRTDDIFELIDIIRHRSLDYDENAVRQMVECVVVEAADRIRVVFVGGTEVVKHL